MFVNLSKCNIFCHMHNKILKARHSIIFHPPYYINNHRHYNQHRKRHVPKRVQHYLKELFV